MSHLAWSAGVAGVLLCASGCSLSPLARHAVAFNQATGIVIDSSEDAYAAANRLHHEVVIAKAVAEYDTNPQWSPYRDAPPLLTPDQMDARLQILDGLKTYAATLVELTSGKPNPALDAAAEGIGSNMKTLSGTVATKFGGTGMNETEGKAVSVAANALGQFLVDYTTRKSLKQVTATMAPTVTSLCELLQRDVRVLRRQADVEYQTLLTQDDQAIRHATVDPFTHRAQVARLIELAAQQKANDELLARLEGALRSLDAAHQALAGAAQGKDADGLKQKMADLSAAGQGLATFYRSLSATDTDTTGAKR